MSFISNKPNILLAISDDQAWPYAGAYGCSFTDTPGFDRISREGAVFTHAFCPAPQCAPSRSALLTGGNIWQLEEAGTHSSLFPNKFRVYTDSLEQVGYHVGYTGKPWGPGNWQAGGRTQNPSGKEYNNHCLTPPTEHISTIDYKGNFAEFLDKRPDGAPFCFWYGGHEPHRKYAAGSGVQSGKRIEDVQVPPFLPDVDEVRSDLLDYALEIEWFDRHLLQMIQLLEDKGELDNTLIVVTSDNGMPFPRAKANLYELGSRIPFAIRWGHHINRGNVYDDFVSLIDVAPTILQAAGLQPDQDMTGKSLLPLLKGDEPVHNLEYVLTGRERHVHARADNVGYPIRAIRTTDYLYIWNFKPDRWPAGDPDLYLDVDGSPSKKYILDHRDEKSGEQYFQMAFGKRPEEELYDLRNDPFSTENIAQNPNYNHIKLQLRKQMSSLLTEQKDPRILGSGDIFDSYPRYAPMKEHIPGFKQYGAYNPDFLS